MTLELRNSTDPSFSMFMEGQRRNEEARKKRARILSATTKQKRATAVGYIDPEKTQRIDDRRRAMNVNQTSGIARQNGVPRHHVVTAPDGTQTSVEGPRPQEQRVAPSPGPTPPNRMMGLDPRIMGAPPPVFKPHSENYEELITDPEQRFARSRSVPSDKPGPVAPQEYTPEPAPLQGYVGRTAGERLDDRIAQDEFMELANGPLERFEFSRALRDPAGEPTEDDFRDMQRMVQREIDLENGIDPEAFRYRKHVPHAPIESILDDSLPPIEAEVMDPIEELVQEAEGSIDPFVEGNPMFAIPRAVGRKYDEFVDSTPLFSGSPRGFNPFMDKLNPRYPETDPALLERPKIEAQMASDREAMEDMSLEELLEFIRQSEVGGS